MKTINKIKKELLENCVSRVRVLNVNYIDNFNNLSDSQIIMNDVIYFSDEKEKKVYKELIEKEKVVFVIESHTKYSNNNRRETISYYLTAVKLESLKVTESNYFLLEVAKESAEIQDELFESTF